MHLPNMGAYSSLKRALAGISLTAREELKGDNIPVSVVYPYITFKPDTAEYVAQKILAGIASGEAEIFAHEWMNKPPD